MASVVGKTIFSDGKGKLFFGYYKDNDAVEFVDYKTWKKLNFKDVSKGDTNKERVIKAIVKNQKQFNKKVDFNMWAKKQKRSFEDTMDWFIKNGWISNITKRGIKEGVEDVLSVNEVEYKDALADFNKELEKNSEVKKAAKHYKKSTRDVVKALQSKIKVNRYSDKSIKQVSIDYKEDGPLSSKVSIKLSKNYKQNESVNEATSSYSKDIASMTGTRQNAVLKFIDKHKIDSKKLAQHLNKEKLSGRMDFASAISGKAGNRYERKFVRMFGESVDEGILQDREKQLKALPKGARVSGGGYGPFIKTGSNTFKSPKGKLANSQAVIKLLGAFGDFKIQEDKGEVEKIAKQVGKNEIKFYDALSKVEKRLGSKYPKFLDTALKQLKQNPAKFKTNADKEEAIFQSVK